MKKIFLFSIGLLLILAIGGFLLWQHYYKQNTISIITATPTPSPTAQYPKVTKWQVPILMYHYIRNASSESQLGKNLSVDPTNFNLHLKWLKDNDYETLTVADLADPDKKALSKIISKGKKPIAITFDDGYEDAYTNALPILEKYQMTATFYIIRDYIGRPEYMNQEQIDKLAKTDFEIGSHTLSHPDLTKLTTIEAQKQIFDSKDQATTFCYPSGKYNDETLKLVLEAGYLAAVTTHSGIADQDSSILELPRVRIEDSSGQVLGNKINR